MAKGNFDTCLAITLPHEGGYVDHPKDPGGATNMGITHLTLAKWRGVKSVTKAAVKALTLADVKPIYRKEFWDPMGCETLFWGVDLAVFDAGVNSGPARGRKWLLASLDKNDDHVQTVKNICAKRLGFVESLRTFATFGRGWTRRIADIEAKGVVMAASALMPSPGKVIANEREGAKQATVRNGAAAGTSATGGTASGVGTTQPEAVGNTVGVGIDSGILTLIAIVLIIGAGFFAWRWYINRHRYNAYKAVTIKE